jgi:hypothetical protein
VSIVSTTKASPCSLASSRLRLTKLLVAGPIGPSIGTSAALPPTVSAPSPSSQNPAIAVSKAAKLRLSPGRAAPMSES